MKRLAALVPLVLLAGLLVPLTLGLVAAPGAAPLDPVEVPPAYAPLITAAAASCNGVPEPVLAAQLQQESGWNPNAVSPKGAVGLAQFMPATWATYGRDADGDGRADPRSPADAIWAAARYDCALRSMVAHLPGDVVRLVLAAYNAGPGAVLAAGGVPAIRETQEYVRAILDRVTQLVPVADRHGLAPAAARVQQLVTEQFGVTDIQGLAKEGHTPGSDHYTGHAIDIMLAPQGPANTALGWRIALYLQSNSQALDIKYLIWQGRIWNPSRAAEGWRVYHHPQGFTDPTSLHMDHVHVSVK